MSRLSTRAVSRCLLALAAIVLASSAGCKHPRGNAVVITADDATVAPHVPIVAALVIPAHATMGLRADVARLRSYAQLALLADRAELHAPLEAFAQKCGFSALDAFDEIAVAMDDTKGAYFTGRLGAAIAQDKFLPCVEAFSPDARRLQVGTVDALQVNDNLIAVHDKIVFAGSKSLVAPAVRAAANGLVGDPTALGKRIALGDDRLLTAAGDFEGRSLDAYLSKTATEVKLDALLKTTSAAEATKVQEGAAALQHEFASIVTTLPTEQRAPAKRVVDALKVEVHDADARLTVAELAPDQTGTAFGVLTSLAIYGVSRYLIHSKTVEATRNLGVLESSLRAYAATHHRFPVSGAPVPSTPPRGKFLVAPSAWAKSPWSDLGFSISGSHFYQYAIETSPDGMRCTVTARADIDENGVTSLYTLEEEIGPTGDVKRAKFVVTNEDE